MPTIHKGGSWSIMMYPADHNPPHFHVIHRSGKRAVVEIETFAVMGEVPATALREALAWAKDHRPLLRDVWSRLQRG